MIPAYADTLTTVVRVFCVLILLTIAVLAAREVRDCHRRGMARVHRGRSWEPRPVPAVSVTPEACRGCADHIGWHDLGCAWAEAVR